MEGLYCSLVICMFFCGANLNIGDGNLPSIFEYMRCKSWQYTNGSGSVAASGAALCLSPLLCKLGIIESSD